MNVPCWERLQQLQNFLIFKKCFFALRLISLKDGGLCLFANSVANHSPNRIVIDGKQRVLCKRKYCLECSPFGEHNTRRLENKSTLTDQQRRMKNVQAVMRRRAKIKQMAIDYKGGKCYLCGYDKCTSALEFHHINPEEKLFSISHEGTTRSWESVKKELDKCVLLCSNCHREVEAGVSAI